MKNDLVDSILTGLIVILGAVAATSLILKLIE